MTPTSNPASLERRADAWWRWGPVAIYAAAIFLESSIGHVPALPSAISDKQVHAVMFGGLAVLVLRAVAAREWRRVTMGAALVAVVLTSAYGASDEFHQRFVPGRTADVADWVADTVGAGVAASVVLVAARLRTSGPRR